MARKPNVAKPKKAHPTLPAETYACLESLVPKYGSNVNEVARYLILREVDDLTRAGVLPKA